jgi:hypothetical protein
MNLRRSLMPAEQITVTFPPDLVREIDRREGNRSRFIQEAVRQELERRRRVELELELELSLCNPHPETRETAELGLGDWLESLPVEADDLLDPETGTDVCWIPGEGWREVNG